MGGGPAAATGPDLGVGVDVEAVQEGRPLVGHVGDSPVLLAKVFLAVSDGVERCADLDPDAPRILETILTLLLAGIEATSTPARQPTRSDA